MNKLLLGALFGLSTALYAEAASAPSHLDGKTVALNYTEAQYQSIDEETGEPNSSWVSFAQAGKGGFGLGGINPKATRNLLPITRPGQGGVYTYKKTGPSTAVIEVDMMQSKRIDMYRVLTLTFITETTAVATEKMCSGDYGIAIRNINVTIK